MKINLENVKEPWLKGKPFEIFLEEIEEDPNQPRTNFDEEKMSEMVISIKEHGVIQPVSVRRHPNKLGKWILNFGGRRYRGALAAGKEKIPAFIDESYDEFKQIVENEQRENLKPIEIAIFIKNQLNKGLKKKEIAKKLGKDNSFITEHLSLFSMPSCIEQIYRTNVCISPTVLYDMQRLYKKFPEKVEGWCKKSKDITKRTVAMFADELKVEMLRQHNKEFPKKESLKKIKKPKLLVEYKDEEVLVLLNKEPSFPGLIWVCCKNKEKEIEAYQCRIKSLSEGKR